MKNLLAVVVATSLMTVACSDDTVTPTTDKTYIPSPRAAHAQARRTAVATGRRC